MRCSIMPASLAQVFWEALVLGIGSNILVFGLGIIFFAALFYITRQSLSSSLLIGLVALDGMAMFANEPIIDLLLLTIKVLIVGVVGFGLATGVFKK